MKLLKKIYLNIFKKNLKINLKVAILELLK
jgi:hypothetical protein